ncbi:MAG: peptidylprolyl isomerase [Acidobacteriota bacterium]
MLKAMRNSFKHLKWILVFVVFVFVVFVFAQWGGGASAGADEGSGSYVARVNGDTISTQDFDRAVYFTQKNYEQMYGQSLTPEILKAMNLPQQVLGSLVERKLLLQQAARLELTATEGEVRKRIYEIPVLNPEGKFVGADLYQRYVTSNLGYPSAAAFERDIREEVTLSKLQSAMVNSVILSPQWAQEEYRRRNENAKIQYVLFPADRAASSVAVRAADVESYYKEHANKYTHAEQRKVKYLLADLAQIRSQIEVNDDQLRKQYEQSREAFKTGDSVRASHILIKVDASASPAEASAAKAKADALLAQLKAGADFATLAKANSADPGSAVKGGDLGFFQKNQMVPEFEQLAFSLPVGQLSDVFKTQFGYHILKVTEKRPAGYAPFDEVKPQLERQIRDEKAATVARERIAEVRARMKQSAPKTDQEFRALAAGNVSFNDTGWFGKNDPINGLGRNPELSSWAFAAKQNDIGEILQSQRGPLVPILTDTRPAGVPPLDEIRSDVEADAKTGKAAQAAAQQLAAALSGHSLEDAAKTLSLNVSEATVTRLGAIAGITGNSHPLVEAALSSAPGQVKGPVVIDQGAVAFRVTEQKKFDPALYSTERESFMSTMQINEARKLQNSLVDKLKKEAKIETNEKLLQERSGVAKPGA